MARVGVKAVPGVVRGVDVAHVWSPCRWKW